MLYVPWIEHGSIRVCTLTSQPGVISCASSKQFLPRSHFFPSQEWQPCTEGGRPLGASSRFSTGYGSSFYGVGTPCRPSSYRFGPEIEGGFYTHCSVSTGTTEEGALLTVGAVFTRVGRGLCCEHGERHSCMVSDCPTLILRTRSLRYTYMTIKLNLYATGVSMIHTS